MKVKDDKIKLSWREYFKYQEKDFFKWGSHNNITIKNNEIKHLELNPFINKLPEKLHKLNSGKYKRKKTVTVSGAYHNEDTDEVCTADFVFKKNSVKNELQLSFENKRNFVEWEDVKDDLPKVAKGLQHTIAAIKYDKKCPYDMPSLTQYAPNWVKTPAREKLKKELGIKGE